MTTEKNKEEMLFNCSDQREVEAVISRFTKDQQQQVRTYLKAKCEEGVIGRLKHWQVYLLIEKHLGFAMKK